MKLNQHLLRLIVGPRAAVAESVHLVARSDIQWGTPVFRAPALPTAHQIHRELPFTAELRPPGFKRAR